MAGSVFQRIWDTIKPVPPAPRREWETKLPPLWKRIWDGIKPPPPFAVPPASLRRRRLTFVSAVAAILALAMTVGVRRYIKSAPERAESVLREGIRLAAAGDNSGAIDRFNRAIAIRPDFAAAYLHRGLARRSLHGPDAAIADLAHALAIDPRLAAAHSAMGLILRDLGPPEEALAEFTAALSIQPDEDAYYQRGQIYESLGRHEKAIEDYNAAIGLLPNAPYVYRARATAELSLGDHNGANRDRSLAVAIEHSGLEDSQ
jgi:tetratricopeptide (TPR) repeat protein